MKILYILITLLGLGITGVGAYSVQQQREIAELRAELEATPEPTVEPEILSVPLDNIENHETCLEEAELTYFQNKQDILTYREETLAWLANTEEFKKMGKLHEQNISLAKQSSPPESTAYLSMANDVVRAMMKQTQDIEDEVDEKMNIAEEEYQEAQTRCAIRFPGKEQ